MSDRPYHVKFEFEPTMTTTGVAPSLFPPVAEANRKWPPTSTERIDARLSDIEARLAGMGGAVARLDRESRDALAALTTHSKGVAMIEGLVDALFVVIEDVRALKEWREQMTGDGK